MLRYFNTKGSCNRNEHYMVRLDERVEKTKRLFVDRKKYFVINRGRQYGKTTTLKALAKYLEREYVVFLLDFQEFRPTDFDDGVIFSKTFVTKILSIVENAEPKEWETIRECISDFANKMPDIGLDKLFVCMSSLCKKSACPIVLMIDNVDNAGNKQVFIDFLSQLRGYYMGRDEVSTFHSVILASVHDVRSIQSERCSNGEYRQNSPWNIAADFDIEMGFSASQIAAMLEEYETDNHTGMDIQVVAEEIYQYTSGYPYLVSAICKQLDEKILGTDGFETMQQVWTRAGVARAVRIILKKNPPLFGHMTKQLDTYPDLRNMIENIIYRGKRIPFSPEEKSINLGVMFGFLKEENDHVAIANRIFEMCLLNLFMAQEAGSDAFTQGEIDRIQFVKDKRLDMDLVLKKFVEYFCDIYGDNDWKFVESQGRKLFLLYLKPIINGVGNYYIEAQTRDARRTDVIVDYLGEQFIVELKIWHGNEYNERGEQQLTEYLEYYHQDKGYMLSFNFNQTKTTGVKEIAVGGKTIVEAVV